MYQAIIFDLWNTLAQIQNLAELRQQTLELLGSQRQAQLMQHFRQWHQTNSSSQQFISQLDQAIKIQDHELKLIQSFIAPQDYRKFPETDSVLEQLQKRGIRLALLTNSPPSSHHAFEEMGLAKYFEQLVFSCDVGLIKPDPAIFQLLCQKLKLAPQDCLMVGDSLEQDVQGALNAGLQALLIDRQGQQQPGGAKAIQSLQSLL